MKITITQEDIDEAIEAKISESNICKCCVAFQALRRNGIPVEMVGFEQIFVMGHGPVNVGKQLAVITDTASPCWQSTLGLSFEVSDSLTLTRTQP